jgi:hypothetical protein
VSSTYILHPRNNTSRRRMGSNNIKTKHRSAMSITLNAEFIVLSYRSVNNKFISFCATEGKLIYSNPRKKWGKQNVSLQREVIIAIRCLFLPTPRTKKDTTHQLISVKRRRKNKSNTIDHFASNNGLPQSKYRWKMQLKHLFLTRKKRASLHVFTAHLG